MTQTLTVRNLTFGSGRPKLCAPIVGRTQEEICAQAKALAALPVEIAEWRMDWFAGVLDPDALLQAARALRGTLPALPLLFTFRTVREGGCCEATQEAYLALCRAMAEAALCDLLDVELFTGEDEVRGLIETAHRHGVAVVVSSHDFSATPPTEELLARLRRAEALGADLPKLAVMPRSARDVLRLLDATLRYRETGARPAITMSMGPLGAVSRAAGEVFGSCMTFGAAAQASAPGQIDARTLAAMLEALRTQ